jgi:hypothetical protein
MRIERIPKKVFGSNAEFVILRLLYNNGYDRFKREELDVLLEVFNVFPAELKNKLILEDFEYQIMQDELDRNSKELWEDCVFELYFPFERDSKSVFRRYGDFYISFLKLDENHLATKYWFENIYFPDDIYPYEEYFEYQNKLYKITHRLDYDLIDDYPKTATEDLTNIVPKDKLVFYLKCLVKRYGKPVYVQIFKPDHIIKFLDFMYPNRGAGLFELMKMRMIDENLLLGASGKVEGWDIYDFIKLIHLSEKFYNLEKEVQ